MVRMEITADNPLLQEFAALARKMNAAEALPITEAAFQSGAKKIADAWKAYAAKKEGISGVPDMKKPSASYMKGVRIKKEHAFSYIVSNESAAAPLLEYGSSGYDMKLTHPFGKKSRVGQRWNPKTKMTERVPYLIVPFGWGTANTVTFHNTMSESIYETAKRLKKSLVMEETHFEDNWAKEAVERNEYQWAGRLQGEDLGNAEGMVRMEDKAGKGSTYWTFRVISARSPKNSWINKGMPARHVTEGLRKQYSPEIEADIREAIQMDLGISS